LPDAAGSFVTADSSGNVGIGTSSPSAPLHIERTGGSDAKLLLTSSGAYRENGIQCDNYDNLRIFADDANLGGASNIQFDVDGTERMRIDSSGNLKFDSGYGSAATAYGCRAWVNFNGTGTVAIRESGNVSSITDNGTGDYTVNFTTAMPDSNYCPVSSVGASGAAYHILRNYVFTSTTYRMRVGFVSTLGGAITLQDSPHQTIGFFR
jgi:hypothetical protein